MEGVEEQGDDGHEDMEGASEDTEGESGGGGEDDDDEDHPPPPSVSNQQPDPSDNEFPPERDAALAIPPFDQCIAFLARLSYMWHAIYGLLTCLECESAVEPKHARSHALQHAKAVKPTRHIPHQSQFDIAFDVLDAPEMPIFAHVPISPIPGLPIVMQERCLVNTPSGPCHYIATPRTIRDHLVSAHSHHPDSSLKDVVPCQMVFNLRTIRRYVHVDPQLAEAPTFSTYDLYMTAAAARPPRDITLYQAEKDPSKKSDFLYASKWDRVLDGASIPEVVSLFSPPDDEEPLLQELVKCVYAYIENVAAQLPDLNTLYLRHIGTAKGYADIVY